MPIPAIAATIPADRPGKVAGALTSVSPHLRAEIVGNAFWVYRGPFCLGAIFRAGKGWVSTSHLARQWHRSVPTQTAALAAFRRWGEPARYAVLTAARGECFTETQREGRA